MTDKPKKILEQSYADLLDGLVNYVVEHDEQTGQVFDFLQTLTKALADNLAELKLQPRLLAFYQKEILALEFICLPLLDDKEVLNLVRNNLLFSLAIPDYDLLKKLKNKLINIIPIDDRNRFKSLLHQELLKNTEKISPTKEIQSIQDWLKNYISELGLDEIDKLAKAQYLINLQKDKHLSETEWANLKIIFNFYDWLNRAADEPEGYEEEPPIVINGKLFIFRQGILDPVPERKDLAEAMALAGETANKNSAVTPPTPARPASSAVTTEPDFSVSELEQALKTYAPGSLEFKALSQEISRLKKAEFRQAQKSDVLK